MITHRFTKFATGALVAAALGLGGIAAAATASAETYQGGVIGGPDGGKAVVQWQGSHNGSAHIHWHNN
jgi:hypothetical protein